MVVVLVAVVVVVVVLAIMGVPRVDAQNPNGDPVDKQSDDGNEQSLVEADGHRVDQTLDAFPGHQQGKHRQKNGARVTGQRVDLPRPKGKPLVACELAGVDVGGHGDGQCRGMRGHVQAIG